MTDIWSGNIALPDGSTIKDVILTSTPAVGSPAIVATALRFLASVDAARIPLYLAAGPSLDVCTSSEDTQAWFESLLSSKPASIANASGVGPAQEWWSCARSQSPIGILTQVVNSINDGMDHGITEILFYGTVATPAYGGLPTPPTSSPDSLQPQLGRLPELRVHALPLSSHLLHQSHRTDALPSFPALTTTEDPARPEPQFLPTSSTSTVGLEDPLKRKRDIFEEATQLRKKARRKGGEGVSAAAAATRVGETRPPILHRKSLSIDTRVTPFPDIRPASAGGAIPRPSSRLLSRSPSISSETRPSSRKGLSDGQGKRSTLSQVATVPLHPDEPTVETRNKDALSKVVMAAMRMHGLQQRRKNRSRRGSVVPVAEDPEPISEEAAAGDAVKDDEYKLIYHQTYKGAALAFRKHISSKPLHLQADRLRDVVERLLAIYCTDPLIQPLVSEEAQNPLATPGGQKRPGIPGSSHSRGSPFDLPSGSRSITAKIITQQYTGSPVSRKKSQRDGETADPLSS